MLGSKIRNFIYFTANIGIIRRINELNDLPEKKIFRGFRMFNIEYVCFSHIGNCRKKNEDNYNCAGRIRQKEAEDYCYGIVKNGFPVVFAVFDGLGGEEFGEIASQIAAEELGKMRWGKKTVDDLKRFCAIANDKICSYALENDVCSMGTTAAILLFFRKEVFVCNIGDSKVILLSDGRMNQISYDHVIEGIFKEKAPLTQNLGIAPEEMQINPYFARGFVNSSDVYLLCSDGLTDMVSTEEIEEILRKNDLKWSADRLLNRALECGGKDNITLILCRVIK